jgi:O-methyltransferase
MNFLNLVDPVNWPASLAELSKLWLLRRVRANTLASRTRLGTLFRLAREIDRLRIPGALVECGVFKGGSAGVLAKASSGVRPLFLFDSFEGLPPPGEHDGRMAGERYQTGWCAATEADVLDLLQGLGIPRERIHIIKGWFQDTLPTADVGEIALLHIDADWYDSVKLCLDVFYDRVQPGGFIVFDDYGRWEGCTRAVDEFIANRGLNVKLDPKAPEGHFFQKPRSEPTLPT